MENVMKNDAKITPSQKIKFLRELNKCTQETLAEALKCSKSKISKVESGEWEYSEEDMKTAKEFFGVKNAPFTESECLSFKQGLYKWKDLIRNGFIDEAHKYQKNFSIITKLPFEPDLGLLYKMFEIRFVLKEGKPEIAEEMLLSEESDIKNASNENQHHYYYNMGSVYLYRFDFKNALRYYLKALNLEEYAYEKDFGLHFNLAVCYGELGKYVLAISTMEKLYHDFDYNRAALSRGYLNSVLGINYVRIGQVTRGKELISRSLSEALGEGHEFYTCFSLHNYGCACFKAKEYAEAITYFDRVLELRDKVDKYYLENIYYKVRCLIADKKNHKARHLLFKVMPLAEGNEFYSFAFESLSHLISINNDKSIAFIEQKSVPYFINKHVYYMALDYCELLESVFKKRGRGYKTKHLEIISLSRDIIKIMTLGEEVTADDEENGSS